MVDLSPVPRRVGVETSFAAAEFGPRPPGPPSSRRGTSRYRTAMSTGPSLHEAALGRIGPPRRPEPWSGGCGRGVEDPADRGPALRGDLIGGPRPVLRD